MHSELKQKKIEHDLKWNGGMKNDNNNEVLNYANDRLEISENITILEKNDRLALS